MTRIVKLAAILPEDIVFELPGGSRHRFPGDPPLELILRISTLFERSENADSDEVGLEVLRELDDLTVDLLRMRDPEITSSPFGVMGVQHVVSELLSAYGFGTAEGGEADADPPKAKASKKSTRSSGSRSS